MMYNKFKSKVLMSFVAQISFFVAYVPLARTQDVVSNSRTSQINIDQLIKQVDLASAQLSDALNKIGVSYSVSTSRDGATVPLINTVRFVKEGTREVCSILYGREGQKNTILCQQDNSSFVLNKLDDSRAFELSYFGDRNDKNQKTINTYVSSLLYAPYMIGGIKLITLLRSPNISIQSIDTDFETDRVIINFSFSSSNVVSREKGTNNSDQVLKGLHSGTVSLVPSRRWSISDYELAGTAVNGIKFVWKGSAIYSKDLRQSLPVFYETNRLMVFPSKVVERTSATKQEFVIKSSSFGSQDSTLFSLEHYGVSTPSANAAGFAVSHYALIAFVISFFASVSAAVFYKLSV